MLAAPASVVPLPAQGLGHRIRASLAGTPGRLRVLTTVAVTAALVFSVIGAGALFSRSSALEAAQANAEQLVRIQTIRTRLVQADADAANAFLVGGLEPAARRAAYVAGIATASSAIATASGRSPDDAEVLAEVNESLSRYTGLVEAARANNRQGLAVGATYLQQASALLRTEVLPKLTSLVDDNQARVQEKYDDSAETGTTFGGLLTVVLIALVVGQIWLAARTRRFVNVGLASATAIVLLLGTIAGATMLWSQTQANRVHTRAYAATVELAQARIDGFDAKSAEALTLVARGSGEAYEDEFVRVAADARVQLAAAQRIAPGARPAFDAFLGYLEVHKAVRAADNSGDFAKAVQLATGEGGANAAFAVFDQTSSDELDVQSAAIVADLRGARRPLNIVGALVLLGGLLAAFAARRGVAARLQEYR